MPDPILITLDSGRALWFEYFRGKVIEQSKRSETDIGSDTFVTHTLNGSYAQSLRAFRSPTVLSKWYCHVVGPQRG